MGIHYDYKSKRGERAMLKEAKRKARLAQKRAKKMLGTESIPEEKKEVLKLKNFLNYRGFNFQHIDNAFSMIEIE